MKLLLGFVVVSVVLLLLTVGTRKQRTGSGSGAWPYCSKTPLSAPEQILYWRLVEALPGHIVLAQVGLSRIVAVRQVADRQAWLNRILGKSVDFAVCRKDSSLVAVIELDDASHDRAARRSADETKNKALSAAGIRLIRWHAKSLPDRATIVAALATPEGLEGSTLPSMSASRT
jgi:hypothetical protein